MTGISSYSTTASENVNANTGINWDEGMAPAAVNNSARQNMADIRSRWNDASWFQYGIGSKTVAAVYASGTSFTLAGGDATAYWHIGRRVKAVGSTTGTIYGSVSSSSYAASTTTVNVVWDSGSLSNESLTIYAGTAQVTGMPLSSKAVAGTKTNDNASTGGIGEFASVTVGAGAAVSLTTGVDANITSLSLAAGDYDVDFIAYITGQSGTSTQQLTASISTTSATTTTSQGSPGRADICFGVTGIAIFAQGNYGISGRSRISLASTTTIYLVGNHVFSGGTSSGFGSITARRVR